jgi:DNA-binding HxlR family transcriptional regulator
MSAQAENTCTVRDAYRQGCPCRELLDLVANRWTALIIDHLTQGPQRFGQLKRRLEGVSQKMLSQSLRRLERDGLVTRTIRARPLEVHYALTELGQSVAEPLTALRGWSETHVDVMLRHREAFDLGQVPERLGWPALDAPDS